MTQEMTEQRILDLLEDCIKAKSQLSEIQRGLAHYIMEHFHVDDKHFDGLTRILRLDFTCHRCFRDEGQKIKFYGTFCPVCGGEAV